MFYFTTRYAAKRAFPNAIIRKIPYKVAHVVRNVGDFVVFNDYSTYEDWKRCGYVK